jgi:hypothetical protein
MLLSASKTVQENGSVVKPHLFKCAAYSNATLFEKKNSDLVVAMMADGCEPLHEPGGSFPWGLTTNCHGPTSAGYAAT